jgi:tRNA threonylcarbamoyladenosine biosynthesis protein TsaB
MAIDSATDVPTFAVGTPAAPGDEVRMEDRRALSRDIERVLAAVLAARGVRARDLAAVLVADGPGSFTGLRIGAAFAKGLCRALGVPLLSAPSLLGAAAHAVRASGRTMPVEVEVRYDALRGECFRARYLFGARGVQVLVAAALAPGGSAPGTTAAGVLAAGAADASAAALLGLVGWKGGPALVAAPGGWEPVYGRPAEAEARRIGGTLGKART